MGFRLWYQIVLTVIAMGVTSNYTWGLFNIETFKLYLQRCQDRIDMGMDGWNKSIAELVNRNFRCEKRDVM